MPADRHAEARLRAAVDELVGALLEVARSEEAARTTPASTAKLVSIEEAAASLGIRRTAFYGLMRRGEVQTHKLGRRRLVSVASLAELARDGMPNGGPPRGSAAGAAAGSRPGRRRAR
jgi:excisionase family DNA binding protein